MTAKELLSYALIETKKNGVPNLLLEDYNYYINKAVQQTINEIYNFYNADQQRTDDLRVLKDFRKLSLDDVAKDPHYDEDNLGKIYEFKLPENYFHMIYCQVQFKLLYDWKCYEKDQKWTVKALRGTGDILSEASNNAYFRPSHRTPYFYIINNSYSEGMINGYSHIINYKDSDFSLIPKGSMRGSTLDIIYKSLPQDTKFNPEFKNTLNKEFTFSDLEELDVNTDWEAWVMGLDGERDESGKLKEPIKRPGKDLVNLLYKRRLNQELVSVPEIAKILGSYSESIQNNVTVKTVSVEINTPDQALQRLNTKYNNVILQIRIGEGDVFTINNVFIDYIKTPQLIRLTQRQFDQDIDTSQVLEFPEYICQEIINRLTKLLLENYGEPRLQTNAAINNTIAPPAEVQQQQAQRR